MLKSIKVGMIGAGGWGENVLCAYQQNPYTEVAAIADLNAARAEEMAKKYKVPKV